jgi:glycosyltransferase involved in cell wall biosynthesis
VTALHHDATVLALIPHHGCEQWLDDAITSLLDQHRRPDGIVVIDDASPDVDAVARIVRRHPEVALLHADRNVGPYALIQQVIDQTGYDAYLFQDADDWSAPDRLGVLLETARRTGAELVGSWELRVLCDAGEVMPVTYPTDASAALAEDPTAFTLLHPTSLVARPLIDRIGGYATGLRFSGDAEFLWRAAHVARIANAPSYSYHRRKRAGSLTTATASGLHSPARLALHHDLRTAAHRRHAAASAGQEIDLTPHAAIDVRPILSRVCGPELRPRHLARLLVHQ